MCHTNYISSLFVPIPTRASEEKKVRVSMKRSDGEIFTAQVTLLTEEEAKIVRKIFSHFEELRTCECTKDSTCIMHKNLEKK